MPEHIKIPPFARPYLTCLSLTLIQAPNLHPHKTSHNVPHPSPSPSPTPRNPERRAIPRARLKRGGHQSCYPATNNAIYWRSTLYSNVNLYSGCHCHLTVVLLRTFLTQTIQNVYPVRIVHMNERLLHLINLLFVWSPYERVLVFLLDIWRQRLRQQFFYPADIRIIIVLQNGWKQVIKNLCRKQRAKTNL